MLSLQESCRIYSKGDPKLEKRLENFEKVSAGMLIEYNIFFGGSVLTKRRPAWFDVCCIQRRGIVYDMPVLGIRKCYMDIEDGC